MKLHTEMLGTEPGDALLAYDADCGLSPERQAEHDAMAAHAYKRELANMRKAAGMTPRTHERQLVLNLLDVLDRRAAEILAGWMGEDWG